MNYVLYIGTRNLSPNAVRIATDDVVNKIKSQIPKNSNLISIEDPSSVGNRLEYISNPNVELRSNLINMTYDSAQHDANKAIDNAEKLYKYITKN